MCQKVCLQYYCQTCGERTGSQIVPVVCDNRNCPGVPPGARQTQFQAVPKACTDCLRKASADNGGERSANEAVNPIRAPSTVTININTPSTTQRSFDEPQAAARASSDDDEPGPVNPSKVNLLFREPKVTKTRISQEDIEESIERDWQRVEQRTESSQSGRLMVNRDRRTGEIWISRDQRGRDHSDRVTKTQRDSRR